MENELATSPKSDIEVAFDTIPEEVLQFIISDAFQVLISGIQKVLALSDIQMEQLKTGALAVLLRLKSADLVYQEFLDSGIEEELAQKMMYAIQTELVERAVNITDFYTNDPTEEEEGESAGQSGIDPEKVKAAPSPEDILASLEERLTKSRVVTPTTRTYDQAPQSSAPVPVKRSIDPYREIPEK